MPLRRFGSTPRLNITGTSLAAFNVRDVPTLHFGSAGAWNVTFNVPMNFTIYGVASGGSSQAQSGGIGSAGSGSGASNIVGIPIRVLPNYVYLLNIGGSAAGAAGGDTYFQIVGVQLFLHLGGGQSGLTAVGQPGASGGPAYVGAGSVPGGNGGGSDDGVTATGLPGGSNGGTGGGGGGGLAGTGNGHASGAGGGARGGIGMDFGLNRSGGAQPGIGDAAGNATISVTADDGGGGGGGTGVQIPGSSVYYGAGGGGAGGGATIPGIGKSGAFTFVFTGLGS
jgi:hypothetical protein